jgi:exosortase A-associated hydrolase 1
MRRLLTFECRGEGLGATLDGEAGTTGILFATGGTQTRIGSHRMFECLAMALGEAGYPCLRFDRRGVGDSGGEDPGWRESGPDLEAAAAAFRRECPQIERFYGLGLCDGAAALALHGEQAGLDGLILVNPWMVEAEAGVPPPAAIRRHYRDQLTSLRGWKKLFSGSVSYGKLLSGVRKGSSNRASPLSEELARQLANVRAEFILATRDATATAAKAELKRHRLGREAIEIDSDSHTFARPGDPEALLSASLLAIRRLEARARP